MAEGSQVGSRFRTHRRPQGQGQQQQTRAVNGCPTCAAAHVAEPAATATAGTAPPRTDFDPATTSAARARVPDANADVAAYADCAGWRREWRDVGWCAGRVAFAPPGVAIRYNPRRVWGVLSVPSGTSCGPTATATAKGPPARVRRPRAASHYAFDATFRYDASDALTAPATQRTPWAAAAAPRPFRGCVELGVVSFLSCKPARQGAAALQPSAPTATGAQGPFAFPPPSPVTSAPAQHPFAPAHHAYAQVAGVHQMRLNLAGIPGPLSPGVVMSPGTF